ncbi:FtsX-like permease family protein [Actinoplanes sp. NEAU-A12]|uniref:FtsX-like permease family protein n=1 Tax=Actinoplanes sandaracinus TaxID=3045177 RepID=A0ABT6WK28_9ACTN|nr:FtsX-like permease family protein [Actinoplanes sandaracinus]MDI6100097.1 FtsX-like permease family protein [Actinoplanes sandaracinus]
MSAAWAMVRHRFASFAGTFVAVFLGVAVVAGSATLYLSSRPQAPARYDQAPVLVTPPDPGTGDDRDRRAWTAEEAAGLAARLGAVPGVAAAVPDPWFYVQRVEAGRPAGDPQAALVDGHAWSSAVLGGYRLTSGRAPAAPGEVALGGTAAGPATPGAAAPGKTSPDKTTQSMTTTDDQTAGGTTPGKTAPGKTTPSRTTPSRTTADDRVSSGATSGKAAPGGATAGGTATAGKTGAGTTIEVLTSAGPETWTVTGTVDGPGFYLADEEARKRASGVHVIGMTVTGDVPRVAGDARTVIGAEGVVRSGAERDALEPVSVTRIRWLGAQLLIALVMLGTFATVFVVASTCALSAAQRRRELGLLRAVGATPGQVRRLMYAETTLIAVFAGLIGAPAGAAAAPLLAEPMVRFGLEPAGFTVTRQPVALAGAVLLGLVVALFGVTAAARRASRIPPLDALREAAVDPRPMTPVRWVAGVLGAAAGGALLAGMSSFPLESQVTVGLGAAMLLLTAAALLSPVLIGPLVRAVAGPWRGTATGMLVREGTLTGVRRVASTAAPVLATVGLTMLLAGMVATIEVAAGFDETAKYPEANVLVPDGTPGLSTAAVTAQGAEPALTTRLLLTHGDVTTGGSATGGGDGLVLDRLTAAQLQAEAGDTVTVRFVDGAVTALPVSRIGDEVGLPRELVRQHDPDALTSIVVLEDPAVPVIGARALPVHDFVMEEVEEEGRLVDLFLLALIGLTAGYTAIAVGNTLLMATAARRTEFRALRLAGAGTGQVLRVVSAEALLAVATGAVLGGLVAVVSLAGVRAAVENEIGRDIALVVPWGTAAVVTGVCVVLAVLSTAVPVLRRAG